MEPRHLLFLNRYANEIKIYDLNTGKVMDSIQFQPEGPESVGRIYDFHIHNKDSIFLNDRYGYKIHLVDKKAKKINSFSILPENTVFDKGGIPQAQRTALTMFGIYSPARVLNDYLYVSSSPDRDLMEPDFYDSEELGIRINLNTRKYEYLMGYPESHKNNIWGVDFSKVYSTFNEDENLFVYSFPIDENIYTTSNHQSFDRHLYNSISFPKVKPMAKPDRDFSVYYKYTKFNSAYVNILYDSHRKLYYRLGRYKVREEDYTAPTTSLANPQDIVIIVHDASFNKIYEETIKQPADGQIIPQMSFVNQAGLNIAFVDYSNEDKLNFIRFKVVEE